MFKTLGLFILGISIALQGIELLDDPWTQEEYHRSAREFGRVFWVFRKVMDSFFYFEYGLATLLIFIGFLIMNEVRSASSLATSTLVAYGLVKYSPLIYGSDKLGGERIILGCSFIALLVASIKFVAAQPVRKLKAMTEKKTQEPIKK